MLNKWPLSRLTVIPAIMRNIQQDLCLCSETVPFIDLCEDFFVQSLSEFHQERRDNRCFITISLQTDVELEIRILLDLLYNLSVRKAVFLLYEERPQSPFSKTLQPVLYGSETGMHTFFDRIPGDRRCFNDPAFRGLILKPKG